MKFSLAVPFLLAATPAVNAFSPSLSFVPRSNTQLAMSDPVDSPSLAQTHMQGPLTVTGSGKPLTKDELDTVKEELESLKKEFGLKEPTRSFMDEPDTKWRFGGAPDYSLANLFFLKQRTKKHDEGSLEEVVENLVKTWEMERSHKVDPTAHRSVDQEKFRISANGGKVFDNLEANEVGNYNVLLNACPAELYDAANTSWEQSHDKFHDAFAAFPWEVLDVYSPPPKVAFTWRHWGEFTGTDVEVYYNPQEFIDVLRGNKKVDEVNKTWNAGSCPFHAVQEALGQLTTRKPMQPPL